MAKPYRFRLVLGVLFGVLAGLAEPLLVAMIQPIGKVVFPAAPASNGTTSSKPRIPATMPPALSHIAHRVMEFIHAVTGGMASGFVHFEAAHPVASKLLVILLLPLLMLLRVACGYLNVYFLQWVAVRTVHDLRIRLFSHLQRLSSGFFTQSATGDLMSRVITDTNALLGIIAGSLGTVIRDPITIIGIGVVLVYQVPQLALVVLVVLPLALIPLTIYSRKIRKAGASIQGSYADLANVMHESFTGSRIVKAYNLEEKVIEQFTAVCRGSVSDYMRIVRSQEIPGRMVELMAAIGVAALFVYFTFVSPMSGGQFIQYVAGIFLMFRPIKNLVRLHNQLEQSRAATSRVFELLSMENTVPEPANPRPLRADGTAIRFDHVCFSYGDKEVLRDIQLQIQPGKMVALVGASGAGKTTIANLLLRFYDPRTGAICIGDTDIRNVTTRDLRNHIAVVTQEIILFNDTIRNNIALGRPGATDDEIVVAAHHAFAHEFIMEKPGGYDAVIGEKGVLLSGGQRQRIAIARAVLRNAPILLLDEATSALDTESERAVQQALDQLMRGRTTLCIAHRLSTILHADMIVVLDQGRVVETGPHAELIRRGGFYQKLYDLQFRERQET
ncbi:MAG: ABC transporter ATP-binding protein [Verrucomicrobiota bacterium]|nr:ABC transporter ATP-binding protein [Verrucomicrobiota bacterium]